jgi:hypothetical protein
MHYDALDAVSAGLMGGAVMALVLYLGLAVAPKQVRLDLFYIFGTMLLPRGEAAIAYLAGAVAHAVVSVGLALLYALFFYWIFSEGSNVVGWGLLFGFIHWVVAGANLGVIGALHPLMASRELRRPGPFAVNYPKLTTVMLLFLHLVYGLMVGWLYTAWA